MRRMVLGIFGLCALLILSGSLYTVKAGSKGILLRMGEPVKANGQVFIAGPGLHMKWPFVERVIHIDTRLQTDAAKSSRIYIEEEKYFVVDYYVKWKVSDLLNYYTRTGGDKARAESLMEQKIDNSLRAEFGTRSLQDVVSQDRVDIMKLLQEKMVESVKGLGVQVIDVRLKAIDLPETVQQSVFNSMRAGREKIANQYRADGRREAAKIKAKSDADKVEILAKAKETAAHIEAQGVQESAAIYAKSYAKVPEFYRFYRSLQSYQEAFSNPSDTLVLTPKGDFFRYFQAAEQH